VDELTEGQVAELHADLLALQSELEAQLDQSDDATRAVAPDDAIGRLTRMDAIQQQRMAIEERRRRMVRRQQVAGSLAAVANGDYGACRRCQEPIGYARLKARPESPFCLACMGAMERR